MDDLGWIWTERGRGTGCVTPYKSRSIPRLSSDILGRCSQSQSPDVPVLAARSSPARTGHGCMSLCHCQCEELEEASLSRSAHVFLSTPPSSHSFDTGHISLPGPRVVPTKTVYVSLSRSVRGVWPNPGPRARGPRRHGLAAAESCQVVEVRLVLPPQFEIWAELQRRVVQRSRLVSARCSLNMSILVASPFLSFPTSPQCGMPARFKIQ